MASEPFMSYNLKRKVIIFITVLSFVLSIASFFTCRQIIDYYIDHSNHQASKDDPDDSDYKNNVTMLCMVSLLLNFLFQLAGIIGSWKEHPGFMITYIVWLVLGTIVSLIVIVSIQGWSSLVSLFLSILWILFCISFYRDLRRLKKAQNTDNSVPLSIYSQFP